MRLATIALGALVLAFASPASAQGVVNVYCSVQVEWCTLAANEFQKASGIKVSMSQKGSGETIAQLKAEAQNPKGDVWFGGTGDPHLQAAEENLTEPYKSPKMAELHPWAVKQNTDFGRQDGRHLCRRAGLRLQHRAAGQEERQGAGLLGRPPEARIQGRDPDGQPQLVGHRLCRRSPRWCS